MLRRTKFALCCVIYTKGIDALCGQNVKFFYVKTSGHRLTTGFKSLEYHGLWKNIQKKIFLKWFYKYSRG